MAELPDAVPPEVEDYLVGNVADAGEQGGRMSGQPGAAGGGRRGGQGQARRMKTKVAREQRTVSANLEDGLRRIETEHQAERLPADDVHARYAIALGVTGIQKVVVDVDAAGDQVTVTGYAKEGLISRKPAAKTAKSVADLLGG